jgi:hypothetical protein
MQRRVAAWLRIEVAVKRGCPHSRRVLEGNRALHSPRRDSVRVIVETTSTAG